MDILTIAIREDETIVGKFKKKKKTFEIQDVVTDKPLLPLFHSGNKDLLAMQCKNIVNRMDAMNAVIYVTFPSFLCRQDCWQSDIKVVDRQKLHNWAETLLQNEIKAEYAVGLPIIQRYEKKVYVSASGIAKSYVADLYEACEQQNLDLAAVEIECAAYVRAVGRWDANYVIADLDSTVTNITAYCSKVGMYTLTTDIGYSALKEQGRLAELLAAMDMTAATWDFPLASPKQIYIVGKKAKEVTQQIRAIRENSNIFNIPLPQLKNIKDFNNTDLLVLPIGTVYRDFFREGDFMDAGSNYEFSAGVSGDRTGLSDYKKKIKQALNLDRYRSYFSRFR